MEDRRISVKLIAEQLSSHMYGLGPSFIKFGHVEALRAVGTEMPEQVSKTRSK
jgi:hypothetical protein